MYIDCSSVSTRWLLITIYVYTMILSYSVSRYLHVDVHLIFCNGFQRLRLSFLLMLLDTMVTGDTYTLKLTVIICFETAHSSLLLLDKLSTINAGSIVIRSIFIIRTHSFCPSPDNEKSIWYRFEDVWCTHVHACKTVPPTLHYIHACMMYPVATYYTCAGKGRQLHSCVKYCVPLFNHKYLPLKITHIPMASHAPIDCCGLRSFSNPILFSFHGDLWLCD